MQHPDDIPNDNFTAEGDGVSAWLATNARYLAGGVGAVAFLVILALAAFGGAGETPLPTETLVVELSETPTPPALVEPTPAAIAPLTGEAMYRTAAEEELASLFANGQIGEDGQPLPEPTLQNEPASASDEPGDSEASDPTESSEAPPTAEVRSDDDRALAIDGNDAIPPLEDRPVLAIKIPNGPGARPQTALDRADVVYEELVEAGTTRFIGLFHSDIPDVVGPVRSGRLVDADVLPAWRPILALSGARDDVIAVLRRAGIATRYAEIGEPDGFFRSSDRSAPNNLYASPAELYQLSASDSRAAAARQIWSFDAEPPADEAASATRFALNMSDRYITRWTYDAATASYERGQNSAAFPTIEGTPHTADNVVVLAMDVGRGGCCDASGASFTTTDVTGSGRAIFLRDGRWYEGVWSKSSATDDLKLLWQDGQDFPLKPGKTWIHLASNRRVPATPA